MTRISAKQFLVWMAVSLITLLLIFIFVAAYLGFDYAAGEPIGSSGVFVPLICTIIPLLTFRVLLYNNNFFLPLLSMAVTILILLFIGLGLNLIGTNLIIKALKLVYLSGSLLGWGLAFVIISGGPYMIVKLKRLKKNIRQSKTKQ